jgi:hypothetical protein
MIDRSNPSWPTGQTKWHGGLLALALALSRALSLASGAVTRLWATDSRQ